jgi:lysophospholipase L1-like esterase
MANFTYVTLVPFGGTPVHLADQTGAPFATTGTGALVFANGPALTNATFSGTTVINGATFPTTGLTVAGPLSVTGASSFIGNVAVTGNLSYTGTLSPLPTPLTTEGDINYFSAGNSTRLPVGPVGFAVVSNGTDPVYTAQVQEVQRRVLLMGDSIAANCGTVSLASNAWPNQVVAWQNDSWAAWANRLTGQRIFMDPNLNKGVSGNTTAQMLARFQSDVIANLNSFDIMILQGGTNDITAGSPTLAQSVANMQSMVTQVVNAGKQVILLGVLPRALANGASSAQLLQTISLNTSLREWAKTQPCVTWVDWSRPLIDPTTAASTALNVLYHGDGLHPSGGGAYRIGQMIANALNVMLPPGPDVTVGAGDTYDSTNNPNGNRAVNGTFFTTTGGTVTNGTGTMPSGWTLQKVAGSWVNAEVTASVATNPQGVNSKGSNQINITVAMGARSNNESFTVIGSSAITTFVPGDKVIAECEMDISGMSNMWYAQLGFLDSDGAQFPTPCWDGYDPYGTASANLNPWDPQTYVGLVFRTPIYTIVKGTQVFPKVVFAFNSTVSAAATIAIRGMTIRKVG